MGGLRFAFYGRVSTEDFQDRASSRTWQREAASELIVGHGAIVAEFFDVGYSRRRAWGAPILKRHAFRLICVGVAAVGRVAVPARNGLG
jgi:hypothetical protein